MRSTSQIGPIVSLGAHVPGILIGVDRIPSPGETVLGHSHSEPVDGGKASNQAVAAARLGAPVALVTVLGSDDRSAWWRTYLESQGVDTQWAIEADGPLDLGIVLLPSNGIPAIVSVMALSGHLDAAAVIRVSDVLRSASVVLCQLESPIEGVRAAFEVARASGIRTILNPSPARELSSDLLALTDILVPNEHEAIALAGHPGSPSDLAQELSERFGVATVVVTAGPAGAYFSIGGGPAHHVQAPRTRVVDTTGAGDAFVGALAFSLRRGAKIPDAVSFAVRVASLTVSRPGSIPSYPVWDDVLSALDDPDPVPELDAKERRVGTA